MTAPAEPSPTISIGMPIFNEERFLGAALDSLLQQERGDLELIVCDNASTDRTGEIARGAAARDRRVRYLRGDRHVGAAENFERPLGLARGKYFMWAAGHDLWAPNFLRQAASCLDAHPGVGLVYPRTRWIDEAGDVLHDASDGLDTTGLGAVARFNTTMWRTVKCTPVYGLWRLDVLRRTKLERAFGADLVLLAEAACYTTFVELPEPLFLRRLNRGREAPAAQVERIHRMMKALSSGPSLPYLEMASAYLRMLARADVPASTRATLFASVALGLPVRYHRRWAEELIAAAPGPIRGLLAKASARFAEDPDR